MTAELKPCHSCGHATAPKIVRASDVFECNCCGEFDDSSGESFAVMCDAHKPNGPGGCGASSGFYATAAEAVEKWNTRAADQRIAALEAENARLRADAERFQRALAGYKKGVSLSSDGSGYINQFLDAIKEAK
jgi:plasmid stabilization system protein ParE